LLDEPLQPAAGPVHAAALLLLSCKGGLTLLWDQPANTLHERSFCLETSQGS
jgi:hypothetical protein